MSVKKFFMNFWKSVTPKQRIIAIASFILIYIPVYSFVSFNQNQYEKNMCLNDNNYSECFSAYMKYWIYYFTGECYLNKIYETGVPMEPRKLLLDIYIVNSNFTNEQAVEVVNGTNLIWMDYGVQFHINSIIRIHNDSLKPVTYKSKNGEKVLKFMEGVVDDRLFREQDIIIDAVFVDKLFTEFKILFWTLDLEQSAGQGLRLNNTNFILFSTKSKNESWVLTHEMGHILGLTDKPKYSGELNLMTHSGCIKDRYYPTVLNQKQVDTVVSTAKFYEHKT